MRSQRYSNRLTELQLGIGILKSRTVHLAHNKESGQLDCINVAVLPRTPNFFLGEPYEDYLKPHNNVFLRLRYVVLDLPCGFWSLSLHACGETTDAAILSAATAALVLRTQDKRRDLQNDLLSAIPGEIVVMLPDWKPPSLRGPLW